VLLLPLAYKLISQISEHFDISKKENGKANRNLTNNSTRVIWSFAMISNCQKRLRCTRLPEPDAHAFSHALTVGTIYRATYDIRDEQTGFEFWQIARNDQNNPSNYPKGWFQVEGDDDAQDSKR
jgi:hypothetical protein